MKSADNNFSSKSYWSSFVLALFSAAFIVQQMYLFFPRVAYADQARQLVNTKDILYTQSEAGMNPSAEAAAKGFATDADWLRDSLKCQGWKGSSIDVVRFENAPPGMFTAVDNTRPGVAVELGIDQIPANVHLESELLNKKLVKSLGSEIRKVLGEDRSRLDRLSEIFGADPNKLRGLRVGEIADRLTSIEGRPPTWGDFARVRMTNQSAEWIKRHPYGAPSTKLGGTPLPPGDIKCPLPTPVPKPEPPTCSAEAVPDPTAECTNTGKPTPQELAEYRAARGRMTGIGGLSDQWNELQAALRKPGANVAEINKKINALLEEAHKVQEIKRNFVKKYPPTCANTERFPGGYSDFRNALEEYERARCAPACVEPPPGMEERFAATKALDKEARAITDSSGKPLFKNHDEALAEHQRLTKAGQQIPEKLEALYKKFNAQLGKGGGLEPCTLDDNARKIIEGKIREISKWQSEQAQFQFEKNQARIKELQEKMDAEIAKVRDLKAANELARVKQISCQGAAAAQTSEARAGKIKAIKERINLKLGLLSSGTYRTLLGRAFFRAIGFTGLVLSKLFSYEVIAAEEVLDYYSMYVNQEIKFSDITGSTAALVTMRVQADRALKQIEQLWNSYVKALEAEVEAGYCGELNKMPASSQIFDKMLPWLAEFNAFNTAYKATQIFKFFTEATDTGVSEDTLQAIVRGMRYDNTSDRYIVYIDRQWGIGDFKNKIIEYLSTTNPSDAAYDVYQFDTSAYPGGKKAVKNDLDKIDEKIYLSLFIGSSLPLKEYIDKLAEGMEGKSCGACPAIPACDTRPYCLQKPSGGEGGKKGGGVAAPAGGSCDTRGFPPPGVYCKNGAFVQRAIDRAGEEYEVLYPVGIQSSWLYADGSPSNRFCLWGCIGNNACISAPGSDTCELVDGGGGVPSAVSFGGAGGGGATGAAAGKGIFRALSGGTRSGKPASFTPGTPSPDRLLLQLLMRAQILAK